MNSKEWQKLCKTKLNKTSAGADTVGELMQVFFFMAIPGIGTILFLMLIIKLRCYSYKYVSEIVCGVKK